MTLNILIKPCYLSRAGIFYNSLYSLLSQLLKAKYYYNCSFFDASVRSSPSYTWRSILFAREVLLWGMRWQIGDGQSVHIWRDSWIAQPLLFIAIAPIWLLPENAKVYVLIDYFTCSWNWSLIEIIFHSVDIKQFQTIPLEAFCVLIS